MPLCVSVYMYLVDSGWGWGSWAGLDCPVGCFAERSGVVPLLLFFFFFVLCLLYLCARLFVCALWSPAWGRGWPLGSRLWYLTVRLSLFHWYSGSSVVLDRIDS